MSVFSCSDERGGVGQCTFLCGEHENNLENNQSSSEAVIVYFAVDYK